MDMSLDKLKFWEVDFRGEDILVIDLRVREQMPEDLYVYHMRHDDNGDWTLPVTIERSVFVDHYGTLISKKPLDLGEDNCIYLTDEESETMGYNQQIMKTVQEYIIS